MADPIYDPIPVSRPDPLAGLPPLPPLDPPPVAAVPMPTPVEPKPARPVPASSTAWVREALGLLVTPGRRKAAAAGVVSLGVGAAAVKYLLPNPPDAPAASSPEVARADEFDWDADDLFTEAPPLPRIPDDMAKTTAPPPLDPSLLKLDPLTPAAAPLQLPPISLPDPLKAFPPPVVNPLDPQIQPANAEVPAPPAPTVPTDLKPPEVKPIELPKLDLAPPAADKPIELPKLDGLPAPAPLELPKVEPSKLDPSKLDPSKLDPSKLDPSKLDPSKLDPSKLDPSKLDPSKLDPSKLDPSKLDPIVPPPVPADPPKLDPPKPVTLDPPKPEPMKIEPPKPEPMKIELPNLAPPASTPADPPKPAPPAIDIGNLAPKPIEPTKPNGLPPLDAIPTATAPKPIDLPPSPSAEIRPAAATTFDVDLHYPKPGDSYAGISRHLLGDDRYAAALEVHNRNARVDDLRAANQPVEVPPVAVLRKRYAPYLGQPTAAPPADPRPTDGRRTFTVPDGGRTMKQIAAAAFGDENFWGRVYDDNRGLRPDQVIPAGTRVRLPADARIGE